MPSHNSKRKAFVLLCLLLISTLLQTGKLGGGALWSWNARAASRTPSAASAAASAVVSDEAAEALLDATRRRLLDEIKARSTEPVRLTLDPDSGAVLLLSFSYPGSLLPAGSAEARATAFLSYFQPLLDPRVNAAEYVAAREEFSCDDSVMTFDRFVGGRPVLGSKLTVHFGRDGQIAGLVNGVASVTNDLRPAIITVEDRKRLQSLLPKGVSEKSLTRYAVAIPETTGSDRHLRQGNLVVWSDATSDGRVLHKSVTEGLETGIGEPSVGFDPSAEDGRTSTAPQPSYSFDSRTSIPTAISYHTVGGVAVERLPEDRNAAELVYRFLGQHRALFRTGAPRCQYRVKQISESPMLPGVQFVRLEQRYVGLPVFGAELVFEVHDLQKVMAVSGRALSYIALDPTPRLRPDEAVNAAKTTLLRALDRPEYVAYFKEIKQAILDAAPTPELVVFPGELAPRGQLSNRLAYRLALPDFVYFIDANTGEEAFSHSTKAHQSVNDGLNQSEFSRLSFVNVIENGVPTGTMALNPDAVPVATSINAIDSFLRTRGWLGLNNRGGRYVVNTNVAISSGCANAFFDTTFTGEAYMCLGTGQQPDVVGHEFTHGVITNSSRLIYQDESGALNESYADLFGNLIFPDTAGPNSWLVGDTPSGVGTGTIRDMATPGNFINGLGIPHPGTMGQYIGRSTPGSGCNLLPSSCDNGFVHSNSGIVNRAHVLLSGGDGGAIRGIGREKLARLALLVMTQRLTPWARLIDAAVATREMANTLVARDTLTPTPNPFTVADTDDTAFAFRAVGLSPDLFSGWSEPAVGFTGMDTFFGSGETTISGCNVANVVATLDPVVSGFLDADLDPATPAPPATNFLGLFGIGFTPAPGGPTPAPIGTPFKRHSIVWFNVFGVKPRFYTRVEEVAGCAPMSFPVERVSVITRRAGFLGVFGASGTENVGNSASAIAPTCSVLRTEVELVDAAGEPITPPGNFATDTVTLFHIFWFPVTSTRSVVINALPGPRPPDLSANVTWANGFGTDVRFRLRYFINQPTGVTCTP